MERLPGESTLDGNTTKCHILSRSAGIKSDTKLTQSYYKEIAPNLPWQSDQVRPSRTILERLSTIHRAFGRENGQNRRQNAHFPYIC
jgi:hypothetical protein